MTRPNKTAARFPLVHPNPEVRKTLKECQDDPLLAMLDLRADYSLACALGRVFAVRDQRARLSDRRQAGRDVRWARRRVQMLRSRDR